MFLTGCWAGTSSIQIRAIRKCSFPSLLACFSPSQYPFILDHSRVPACNSDKITSLSLLLLLQISPSLLLPSPSIQSLPILLRPKAASSWTITLISFQPEEMSHPLPSQSPLFMSDKTICICSLPPLLNGVEKRGLGEWAGEK